MLLACPITGWCHAWSSAAESGKNEWEERNAKEKGTNRISCNNQVLPPRLTSHGFSGQFHIRLHTEAIQTFECKAMEGLGGLMQRISSQDEVGLVERQ